MGEKDALRVKAAVNRCVRCGEEFSSLTGTARFCERCRRNVMREHARRRGLSQLGTEARWGRKGDGKS